MGSLAADIIREATDEHMGGAASLWPDVFTNAQTGRVYTPHNDEEHQWVYRDDPPYALIKGGEGSGKSVAGIIKTLNRLRRGQDGIMVAPNLPRLKNSLWPEFRRWCPWEAVVERHRYRQREDWEPTQSFKIVFKSESGKLATLYVGGIEKPLSWEGPNVNFAYMDEARGVEGDEALKVLTGRVRIKTEENIPPQLFISSTPRMHWLFEYFGPVIEDEYGLADDPRLDFKKQTRVVTLVTQDNLENLNEAYMETRGASLTEAEQSVRLLGEWTEEKDEEYLLQDPAIWDKQILYGLAPVTRRNANIALQYYDSLVLAVDAGFKDDYFSVVGLTRHPHKRSDVVVRMAKEWYPTMGDMVDLIGTPDAPGPETYLRQLCNTHNVVCIAIDPSQMLGMIQRFRREGLAWVQEFNQGARRKRADKMLVDDLITGNLWWESHLTTLADRVKNAGKVKNPDHSIRIVKMRGKKVDSVVALSMGNMVCKELNL